VLSASLLTALITLALCQAFKVVVYSLRDRRPRWGLFFSPGGMPSAHSAFVSALTLRLGLEQGFGSELFSVCFVFAAITVYDSFRLRGAVQLQGKVLNSLLDSFPRQGVKRLPQMVGHSLPEVAAGILVGLGMAVLLHLLR